MRGCGAARNNAAGLLPLSSLRQQSRGLPLRREPTLSAVRRPASLRGPIEGEAGQQGCGAAPRGRSS